MRVASANVCSACEHVFCPGPKLSNLVLHHPQNGKETSVPESVEERIIEILDLLVQLDNLKDMKASILNDFSHYKRCLANVREDQVSASARI